MKEIEFDDALFQGALRRAIRDIVPSADLEFVRDENSLQTKYRLGVRYSISGVFSEETLIDMPELVGDHLIRVAKEMKQKIVRDHTPAVAQRELWADQGGSFEVTVDAEGRATLPADVLERLLSTGKQLDEVKYLAKLPLDQELMR